MSKKVVNLRAGEKIVEIKDVINKSNGKEDDENSLSWSANVLCDKFAVKLREEFEKIVVSLKSELTNELLKRDKRIVSLESEVISLTTSLNESSAKIVTLETQFEASTPPPKSNIDTVVAGDSIVKHINVDNLDGNNQLICLPGARAHKVHRAVRDLASTANIKNLVLHFGTNNIPQQHPGEVTSEIAGTLKQLQLELPDTNIHFSAILPKLDPAFNRGINCINFNIFNLCERNSIGFIQHPNFCRYGQLNKALYAPTEWKNARPIHPSHEGAMSLHTDIKLHLAA